MENDTIVREAARREMTGVSRAQWWRFELEGNAPKRVQLGPGSIGWRRSDLERWVRERPPAAPKGVPTGLPKDELDYLDSVPLGECKISGHLAGRLRTEAARRGLPPVVGSFARFSHSDRMAIEHYGEKCEREFKALVDALLHPENAFGPTDSPPACLSDGSSSEALVERLFRDFLSNPIYNNMTYDGIARRACEAAETFQRVIGKRNG